MLYAVLGQNPHHLLGRKKSRLFCFALGNPGLEGDGTIREAEAVGQARNAVERGVDDSGRWRRRTALSTAVANPLQLVDGPEQVLPPLPGLVMTARQCQMRAGRIRNPTLNAKDRAWR